ncbi:hypothetical protein J4427_03690, partial [Candidatus Woesearchaeota archaeon]|nr:hypothetical protein [Candidatus Woesearchaeota archaeon]
YRPDILKWLIDKNGIFYIKYLPDWMNGNPWKRLWFFFFRWKKEESRLNRYKLISLITFISTLIMLVISYHIIKK